MDLQIIPCIACLDPECGWSELLSNVAQSKELQEIEYNASCPMCNAQLIYINLASYVPEERDVFPYEEAVAYARDLSDEE